VARFPCDPWEQDSGSLRYLWEKDEMHRAQHGKGTAFGTDPHCSRLVGGWQGVSSASAITCKIVPACREPVHHRENFEQLQRKGLLLVQSQGEKEPTSSDGAFFRRCRPILDFRNLASVERLGSSHEGPRSRNGARSFVFATAPRHLT
jgi:hypothetical protein